MTEKTLQTVTQSTAFSNAASFESAQRMAKALCASNLIPKDFQSNLPNTIIALEMAQRLQSSPLAVMQSIYVVHGKPSWSSQYIIAMINSSGKFQPLKFRMEGEGDSRSCTAWTKDTFGEIIEGPTVSIKMAKDEQWYSRNGSKWKTMPELMLRYRAATFFGRLYAPEIMMGMQTKEEINDTYDAKRTGPNEYSVEHPNRDIKDVNETFNSSSNDQLITDHFGEIYDRTKHAANRDGDPVLNADGSFRKRRQPTRAAGTVAREAQEALDTKKPPLDINESSVTKEEKTALTQPLEDQVYPADDKDKSTAGSITEGNEPLPRDDPSLEKKAPVNQPQVLRALSMATTIEELDLAGDLINELPEEKQEACTELYVQRLGEMPED